MAKVSVFRLEHEKLGIGPFMAHHHFDDCDLSYDEMDRIASICDKMANEWHTIECHSLKTFPIPRNDALAFMKDHHFFGATTLNTLKKWFNHRFNYFNELFDAGFTVREYEVSSTYVHPGKSGTQVMFNREKAKMVKDHTMLALVD